MTSRPTPTSPLELLRGHIGHRAVIIEPKPGKSLAIKCIDCSRLTDLSAVFGLRPGSSRPSTTSTSTPSERRDPRPDEQCPAHIGEWRETCRCCASEAKARRAGDPPPISQVRTGADPATVPEVAAVKAQLAQRAAARKRQARASDRHDPQEAAVGGPGQVDAPSAGGQQVPGAAAVPTAGEMQPSAAEAGGS